VNTDLPWSPQQREWLQALGHDVLALAGAASASPARAAPDPAPAQEPAPALPQGVDRDAARVPRAPAPARPATARAPAESTLLRALAQAAGRAPDDGELLRALPPLASLRGNPAARRALWPRLRALRRGVRP